MNARELPDPGKMSFTNTVPSSVPSLFQSSRPFAEFNAPKNNVPFTFVSPLETPIKNEPPVPGMMSFTKAVPAGVPSLFQSSRPFTSSSATKNSVPFTSISSMSVEAALLALVSLTSTVPPTVPSLFQSSGPFTGSRTLKKSVPFTLVRSSGVEELMPGTISLTNTVPAAVPSLFQSSTPLTPSPAVKKRVPFTFDPAFADNDVHMASVGLGLLCHGGGKFLGLMDCTSSGNAPFSRRGVGIDLAYQAFLFDTRLVTGNPNPTVNGTYRTTNHAGAVTFRALF